MGFITGGTNPPEEDDPPGVNGANPPCVPVPPTDGGDKIGAAVNFE